MMETKHVRRRLLINFAGLGDLVLLIPLLRKLAEGVELDLITRPYGVPLFAGQSFIATTFPLRHPNRGQKGLWKLLLGRHRIHLAKSLIKREYDEIYYFDSESSIITDWVESWRGRAVCKSLFRPHSVPDWAVAGLRQHGFNTEDLEAYPRLDVAESDRAAAREKLSVLGERVIAVQAGTAQVNSIWKKRYNLRGLTPHQWGGLITHILEKGDADAVVFHGTPLESGLVEAILKQMPEQLCKRVYDWTNSVGIHELKALLSVHYAMISVDTGPAHIASAVGCPMLKFFGPTSPEDYFITEFAAAEMVQGRAPCVPCQRASGWRSCRDNICLNQLQNEELIDGWQRLQKRLG